MITDQDRFKQDKSPYERPNYPYRCGRLRIWAKPCSRGPDSNGNCGGIQECRPFSNGSRWECRRSARAGGPCEHGPMPDGGCSQRHPPCRPILSLRGYRGRLSIIVLALTLALIAGFAFNDGSQAVSTIIPGTLSDAHTGFTSEKGCKACHAPHDTKPSKWLQASWSPSNLSEKCLDCHTFAGGDNTPHNRTFASDVKVEQTQCVMCHTEHKGPQHQLVKMTNAQCHACHKTVFESFAKGHPPFSNDFPSHRRTAIAFNHSSHLNKHFFNERLRNKAPIERCVSCHDAKTAGRSVPVKPFKQICADCHESQIPNRDLLLFTLPEFESNPFDLAEVREACGPSTADRDAVSELIEQLTENLEALADGESKAAENLKSQIASLSGRLGLEAAEAGEAEEYESVSIETLPALAAMLLGLEDGEDIEEYTEPVRDLVNGMIEGGDAALAELLEARGGDPSKLLSGLSPELLRRVGCAWAANEEYEAPAEQAFGGWFAEALSIYYRPMGHADPVAKAFLDYAAAGGEGFSDDARNEILSRKSGVGACTKCHAVTRNPANLSASYIEWRFGAESTKPLLHYQHRPHLILLGSGQSCETCHVIDDQVAFEAAFDQTDPFKFASNFKPLSKKTCAECHGAERVRQDCTLCHSYHDGQGFKRTFVSAESKN